MKIAHALLSLLTLSLVLILSSAPAHAQDRGNAPAPSDNRPNAARSQPQGEVSNRVQGQGSEPAASPEGYQIDQAAMTFDTTIRVETPARVVEASDPELTGALTSFVQSLLYSDSKTVGLSYHYSSPSEIQALIDELLCQEKHDVRLKPIHDRGSFGTRTFDARMKPSQVTLSGTMTVKGQTKPYSAPFVCKNAR